MLAGWLAGCLSGRPCPQQQLSGVHGAQCVLHRLRDSSWQGLLLKAMPLFFKKWYEAARWSVRRATVAIMCSATQNAGWCLAPCRAASCSCSTLAHQLIKQWEEAQPPRRRRKRRFALLPSMYHPQLLGLEFLKLTAQQDKAGSALAAALAAHSLPGTFSVVSAWTGTWRRQGFSTALTQRSLAVAELQRVTPAKVSAR